MVAYGAGHMCKPTPVHTSVRSDWALSNVLGQCCCLGAVLLRWGLSCCTQSVPPRPPHCVQYCALCLQCYLPLQLCLHAGQTPLPHSRGKCSRDTGRQARITASQYDSPNQYICDLTHCSMEAQTSPVTSLRLRRRQSLQQRCSALPAGLQSSLLQYLCHIPCLSWGPVAFLIFGAATSQ